MVGAILGVGSVVWLRSDLGWAIGLLAGGAVGGLGSWLAARRAAATRRRPAWPPWEMTMTVPNGRTRVRRGRIVPVLGSESFDAWIAHLHDVLDHFRQVQAEHAGASGWRGNSGSRDERAGGIERSPQRGRTRAGKGRSSHCGPPGPIPTGRGADQPRPLRTGRGQRAGRLRRRRTSRRPSRGPRRAWRRCPTGSTASPTMPRGGGRLRAWRVRRPTRGWNRCTASSKAWTGS